MAVLKTEKHHFKRLRKEVTLGCSPEGHHPYVVAEGTAGLHARCMIYLININITRIKGIGVYVVETDL